MCMNYKRNAVSNNRRQRALTAGWQTLAPLVTRFSGPFKPFCRLLSYLSTYSALGLEVLKIDVQISYQVVS